MLEGQLEVLIVKKEVEQTTSAYRNSHSSLPSLLGYRLDELICMGHCMQQEVIRQMLDHLAFLAMFHVQCATLQHEELL